MSRAADHKRTAEMNYAEREMAASRECALRAWRWSMSPDGLSPHRESFNAVFNAMAKLRTELRRQRVFRQRARQEKSQ